MNRTWLWLEDQPSTMGDFAEAIRKAGISVHSFRTPGELINQLIDWRQREDDWLDHVGFLLDIQLAGQQFITCPKEWGDSEKTVRTQNGYDAGLVFCELCILGEGDQAKTRVWTKPPPILLLTILHTDVEGMEMRLARIKERWGKTHDVPAEKAQVDWIRKWDRNAYEKLVQRLRDWGEVPDRRRDSLLAGALLLVLTGTTGGWVLADQPASVTQAGGATAGVQGTAPPPNVPVMVQAPNPTHQTRPAELQVISKEVLDQLLDQQNASIMWFGGLATFIVFVLSVLIRWDHHKLEKTRDKELEQKFDTLIKEKLDTEVENQVKTLFKDRYEERIAQLTKALTQEVLMTTPDAQNKLVSILRRTVNELSSIIIRLPDEGAATELHQLLAHAIEDWYALGQFYSPDREQLETGLLAVRTRPIPEASDRLRRLQQRYQSDLDLLPGIVAAIEAVEQQAVQSERV